MPEVIEVLKTTDFLKKIMKNKYIIDIKILNGRYLTHGPFQFYDLLQQKLPLKVIDIKNKGKFMYFVLDDNLYIYNTFGLRGGWCYYKNNNFIFPKLIDYINGMPLIKYKKIALNNLNISFTINTGEIIYYYDNLSFGTIKVINNENNLIKKLNTLGPDIMHVSYDIFESRIKKNINLNKEIAIVLLNQKIISGIGNYLRSDILWLSKISPFRKIKDLDDKEIKIIFNNAKLLTHGQYNFKKAVKLKIIKSSDKIPYNYNRNFFVYMCETDIYGNKISSEKLYEGKNGRMVYWVSERQK